MEKKQAMFDTIIRDKMFPIMISVVLSTTVAMFVVMYELRAKSGDYELQKMISIVQHDIQESLTKEKYTEQQLEQLIKNVGELQAQFDIVRRDNQKTLYELEKNIQALKDFIEKNKDGKK